MSSLPYPPLSKFKDNLLEKSSHPLSSEAGINLFDVTNRATLEVISTAG